MPLGATVGGGPVWVTAHGSAAAENRSMEHNVELMRRPLERLRAQLRGLETESSSQIRVHRALAEAGVNADPTTSGAVDGLARMQTLSRTLLADVDELVDIQSVLADAKWESASESAPRAGAPGSSEPASDHRPWPPQPDAATEPVLMVRLGEETFALDMAQVEGVARLSPEVTEEARNATQPVFHEQGGWRYRLSDLGAVLSESRAAHGDTGGSAAVILVRDHDTRVGLLVDALQGRLDVVVESLPPPLTAIPWVAGATGIGGDRVALVLSVPALLARISRQHGRGPA